MVANLILSPDAFLARYGTPWAVPWSIVADFVALGWLRWEDGAIAVHPLADAKLTLCARRRAGS
jgi:hypothetical protein